MCIGIHTEARSVLVVAHGTARSPLSYCERRNTPVSRANTANPHPHGQGVQARPVATSYWGASTGSWTGQYKEPAPEVPN